nr:inactive protein RESTRICTED TEV MOVEMENT 2-like [Ipomoea batatas]
MAMRPRGGAGAGPNRPGRTTTVRPVYETFTPVFQRQQDEEAEKLIIYLPGFSKENIKVSTEGKTTLKVRGERLIGNNKWNRFLEEFQAPEDCNMRGIHASVERQKKAVGPKFPKDYEDESPPSPSVLAAAKHGDQKSLEGQEKVTTGGGQKIGLKDFVEGGEKIRSEVKAKGTITQPLFDDDDDGRNKTTAEVDQSVKKTSMTTSGGGGDFRLGKSAEAVKGGGVSDPKEERQLLVNAGVAVLVILALGAYIYNTVGTRKSD